MLKGIKKQIMRNSDMLRINRIQIDYFLKINQPGSGKRKLSIKYNNNKYIFEESVIDDDYFILYSQEKNPLSCVSILLSNKNKNAEIHEISDFKECMVDTNTKVGSTLLKITIKMLKKYKDTFNIKTVTLSDNSLKYCSSNKKRIILSQMLILLNGETWHGRYNFRPFDLITQKLDKLLNKKYEENINIMNKITIKDANILKYIKMTKKEAFIRGITQLLEYNPNMLLKEFLNNFLKDYDETCELFSIFYKKLFIDIGLYNFHKQTFGLVL